MVAPTGGHASLLGRTFGAYEVFGLIGRGAVGTVYVANDLRLKRPVALKVLLGSLARDPKVVKTFHREAQAAAPLRHPNIVRIYSAGIEEGTPYIAMEYVEGEPLDRFIRRKGRIKWQSALFVAQQVAEALDCAHSRGIIHRDVKPANIMLDQSGRVCLMDFGIANIQAEESGSAGEGGFVGTPHYMSPEQCAGAALGPSSDLYSLGVTIYQMIAGALPFDAESPVTLLKRITSDEAPRLSKVVPDVPDDVSRLVAYLMQKTPQDRPADTRTACALIARIQSENGGGSALPAALSSFIREQAQPVSLNVVAPTPWRERMQQRAHRSRATSLPAKLRIAGIVLGAVVAALICGAMVAFASRLGEVTESVTVAPTLPIGAYSELGPDTKAYPAPAGPFEVAGLHWLGKQDVVLLEMQGRKGSLYQGSAGILALDAETGQLTSVRAPQGPSLDAELDGAPGAVALSPMPAVPEDSPLFGAVIGLEQRGGRGGADGTIVARSHRWDRESASGPALFQMRSAELVRPARRPWDDVAPACVAMRPDGYTVCVLLNDAETGGNYLAERDVRWKPAVRMGDRKTGLGGRIAARSVQYSPDGQFIAYIRAGSDGSANLWLVAAGAFELDGRNLTPGRTCVEAAFHSSGTKVAVAIDRGDGADPEIEIIRTDTGAVEAKLGRGLLGNEAWRPSGAFLVVAARAVVGEAPADTPRQLYAIETAPPYRRKVLTSLSKGAVSACSVSRDGRFAAAATASETGSAVVMIDLNARFSRPFD